MPTEILVHDYLTVDGRKLSKSGGANADPADVAAEYGTDAVRWWLLREPARTGDTDYTPERLVARADSELANGLGNLVNRVVALLHRHREGRVPAGGAGLFADLLERLPADIDRALDAFDFRTATGAVVAVVNAANRYVNRARPWDLARTGHDVQFDAALAALVQVCRAVARQLEPFLPDAAARLDAQLTAGEDGRLPRPEPVFRRLGG